MLSTFSDGFGGVNVDSLVIDRASGKYGWDFLDTLRTIKRIVSEVYNKKEED